MADDLDTAAAVRAYLGGEQPVAEDSPIAAAKFNVRNAAGTSGDLEAELRAASARTGVPIGSARANPDVVRARAAAFTADDIAAHFPSTTKLLADESAARLAHDDVGQLTTLETLLNSFKRGVPGLQQNLAATGLRANANVLANMDAVEAKLRAGETVLDTEDPAGVRFMTPEQRQTYRDMALAGAGRSAAAIASTQAERAAIPQPPVVGAVMQAETFGQALKSFMGDPVKFIASIGPESLVQNLPAMAAAIPAGVAAGPWAAGSVLGAGSFATDYGASIVEGLRRAGVDTADTAAVRAAAQDTKLMQRVAAQAMAHAGVVGTVDALSGGVAGKLALPGRLSNVLAARPIAREAANVVAQVPVQGAMGGIGEAGGQVAAGQPLSPGDILAEIVGEAFTAPAEIATTAAGQVRQRVQEASAARAEAKALGEVMQAAAGSKLRTRDPIAFADWVQQAAEAGKAPAEVYVDAKAFTEALQQSGLSLEQAVAALPSLEAQLADTSVAGGDLVIPIGELAAGVAGTPFEQALMQHVRTSPAAPTAVEAAATEADTEALQREVDQALNSADASTAAAAAVETVRDQVVQQLQAAGRFTPDVNNAYASLVSSFYATQAERLGTTPDALFAEMPLRVVAESPAVPGAVLTQPGDTPARWGSVEPGDSPNNMPPGAMTRGLFTPTSNTITLLARADLSTFIHEGAHAFLEMSARMAAQPSAPAPVKADMQALLDWFGHKGTLDEWLAQSVSERRDAHEKFARGFEAFAMEGQAPSLELQSLFQRFRSWLLRVYREITALNVQLTDEVRQVMGRMLATDDQIRAAEEARSLRPLFDSAQAAGMTAGEWTAYQALGGDATAAAVGALERRSVRDMAWLANTKARKVRQLARDAEQKRGAIEAEVRAEVDALPVYQAWQFLMSGKVPATMDEGTRPLKLATPALKEMYGDAADAVWRKLPGANRMLSSDPEVAVHPDVVAAAFGLSSGDELVRLLTTIDPPAAVIEAQTDQRMLERYGDLSSPDALERAAEAAIHNDARARFLEREVNQLGKAVGNRPLLAKAARQFAEGAVARKKVRELRPAVYTAASARAGREAAKAFKAGDTAGAAVAKRTQLLQHQLARVATKAQAEAAQAVDYLRKFDSAAVRKSIDPDYVDQIEALLERYDLRASVTGKAIARRKSLAEWIESQREMGFEPVIDERLATDAQLRHLSDITVEELRGLVDAVRNIEHLGRLKRKLLTVQDQRTFDEAVTTAADSIRGNATRTLAAKIETHLPRDRAGQLLTQYMVGHRKLASLIREMDGGKDGGALWGLIARPMNEAGNREAVMREQATVALQKLFDPMVKAGGLYRKTFIPEIGGSLTKMGRLSVALNTGNPANLQRLMDGEHWTREQVQAVVDTLTEQDLQFVQSVWDYIDSFWPQIAAKERRVTGVEPEKVEASPVPTKFGELRGGYYPIQYDAERSTKAAGDSLAEAVKQSMQGLYTRATTRRGHTRSRVETVLQRPLRLSFDVIFKHVDQVIHDLSWHEFLIDANRLVRAKPIDAAVRTHYGPEVLRAVSATLEDIAKGDIPAQNAFEAAMNHLRAGVSIAGMGWNLMTAVMQPLGFSQSVVRIGPKWVGRGIARWIGDAVHLERTTAWVYERSDMMRLRAKTMNREISEIRNVVDAGGRARAAVQSSFFYFITKMQTVVDVPTWLGAYEKAVAGGADEARAVALADQAVLDSQGGGQIKDLAAIQRGGPLQKLFTAFYSYFSTTYNLTAESVARTRFTDPVSVGRLAVDVLLLYTLPAVLGFMLRAALRGDKIDDDELAKKLAAEQLNYLLGTMVGVRELSAAVSGSFGYSGPAGTRFFSEAANLGKQVAQGDVDAALLKSANNAAGVLFHYPAGQVQRTVQGIVAATEGDAPPTAVVFGVPPKR